MMELWYDSPAKYWEEALPLGNGRIGAMVWSGVNQEKVSLNEDTLWSGYPQEHNIAGADKHYKAARDMAMKGEYKEAQKYIEKYMLGQYTQSYLPMGELVLNMENSAGEAEKYRRSLSLEDAVSRLQYTLEGVTYKRESFVSAADQSMIMKLDADKLGMISFTANITSQLKSNVKCDGNTLILDGIAPSQVDPSYVSSENPIVYEDEPEKKGMRFITAVSFEAVGGEITESAGSICVKGADCVVIRLCSQTSFNGAFHQPFTDGKDYSAICSKDMQNVQEQEYSRLKQRHIEDYQQYYNRVSISLGDDKSQLTIPERLKNWDKDEDMGRYALLFQYGRYLIISGSRPGSQATNLQGIWNQHLRAPWSSNFTVNINTEMNYWPVEAAGLPEFHAPLFDLVNTLRVTGANTAKVHYDAQGFVCHHNTDIWGLSNPVGNHGEGTATYAFWPMSAGWLSSHGYEHYMFTQDKEFLKETAYPAIKDAARFYLDVMIEDTDGTLIFAPSTSPENRFVYEGESVGVSKTTTMTTAIIRETLKNAVACCDILGIDKEFREEAANAFEKMPEYKIGSRGELLEWSEEYEEDEPAHRHNSHLYPLYPGHEITASDSPKLADACRRTLDLRGEEGTGWALAWRINLWARLGDGEKAYRFLKKQLRPTSAAAEDVNYQGGGGCYINLFGAHPPFQMDSNFGVCAGITEMLLQSSENVIHLLPALPKAMQEGSVAGLRARGGAEVDLCFNEGKLQKAKIKKIAGGDDSRKVQVVYGNACCEVTLPGTGEAVEITPADFSRK